MALARGGKRAAPEAESLRLSQEQVQGCQQSCTGETAHDGTEHPLGSQGTLQSLCHPSQQMEQGQNPCRAHQLAQPWCILLLEEEQESETLPGAEETSAGPSHTAGLCGRGKKPQRDASDCPDRKS